MSRSSQRIVAAVIGVLFLVAGVMKAWDPAAFAVDILNYRILPWRYDVMLALYLPWVEILCGLALVSGVGYRGGLCTAAAMFAAFVLAYGSTRPRGLDVECGCFGHGVHRYFWEVLITDTALLAVTIWLIRADLRPLSPVVRGGKV